MRTNQVHGALGLPGLHALKHVVLELEQGWDLVWAWALILVLVNLFKLEAVMTVHVQFGPTGRAGVIVLLIVMVALEQEHENVQTERQKK